MRRAKRTNSLVIVSDHTKALYDDRWIDGVMHYTGMGQLGDQSLSFMQNKTLAQSDSNGVAVHLFEVHKPNAYTYIGQVRLADKPYQEVQSDAEGLDRKVWVFPIRPKIGSTPAIPAEIYRALEESKVKQIRRLSDEEVTRRAQQTQRDEVGVQAVKVTQFKRNPYIAEEAKRRAKGICDLCEEPAPFNDKSGAPYLETHHIQWLARGGKDRIDNTVALCPNCHRRMHLLDRDTDVRKLKVKAARNLI
jgi:5-methylcytosine-specific restriction protein A